MATRIDLSPSEQAELERIASAGAGPLARRARVVLARAEGASLNVIASRVGLHRDSCRRWVLRYLAGGFAAMQHGNTGKPKNVVFDTATCNEIRRRASLNPRDFAEPFEEWSLYKLRDHLMHQHVVKTISVERLRQLLQNGELRRDHWRQAGRGIGPLTPEARRQLIRLAQDREPERARRARVVLAVADGTSIAKVASTLHFWKNSVRRWLEYFQVAGVAGLAHGVPTLREAIVRLTRVPPRAIGESGDVWSLPQLRSLLLRRGVAPVISLDELRRVAQGAGITLAERSQTDSRARRPPAALATAFDLTRSTTTVAGTARR